MKLHMKRFAFLWASACGGRLLFMLKPFVTTTFWPFLDVAFFAFLLAVVVVEILIVRAAAKANWDSGEPSPTPNGSKLKSLYSLTSKIAMGSLVFGFLLVIWDTRDDNQMVLVVLLGIAMNFWWVRRFATR